MKAGRRAGEGEAHWRRRKRRGGKPVQSHGEGDRPVTGRVLHAIETGTGKEDGREGRARRRRDSPHSPSWLLPSHPFLYLILKTLPRSAPSTARLGPPLLPPPPRVGMEDTLTTSLSRPTLPPAACRSSSMPACERYTFHSRTLTRLLFLFARFLTRHPPSPPSGARPHRTLLPALDLVCRVSTHSWTMKKQRCRGEGVREREGGRA